MTSPWPRVRDLFERALLLRDSERSAFLDVECVGAPELRAEVCALLAVDAAPAPQLDQPLPELHLEGLAQDEVASLLGEVVGGFTLRRVLGEGGTSTVYLGERAGADGLERGAVKVLRSGLVSSALAGRFRQERTALASLDHPGIVQVRGAGVLADGRPFLVTEVVEGRALDLYVEQHTLEIRERLQLVLDVCEAVQHAHSHLIVHRDLKASNILVDADGRPRVLDFGIAKLLDADADRRFTDAFGRGPLTLACASPEQIRGGPITTASDVYSLGVLLYRLVTGGAPYGSGSINRTELERRILEDAPVPPSQRARELGARDVPRDLERVILCALRKEPSDRYPTALHLSEDIRRYLACRPVRARRSSPAAAFLKLVRRNPIRSSVCAAVLFALVGIFIGTRRNLSRVVASESVAWRAHRDAVYAFNVMADVVLQLGVRELASERDLELLLADTEARIDVDLQGAPEAEARLRQALARVYLELGEDERALRHARRVVELAGATVGLGWRDRERGLETLAEVAIRRGDPRAVRLSRQRLDLVERNATSDPARIAQARDQLARAQALAGR